MPKAAEEVLRLEDTIESLCLGIKETNAVFFLGRNADYYAAKEGSLKLKEISYVHSEAYPSGELKHGTLALMEKGVYALMISTHKNLHEKNAASVAEVRARGASTIVLTNKSGEAFFRADRVILLPDCPDVFSPVLSCIAMQYISYFVAKYRGCDTDKPRNLAKSVTVE